LNLKSIFSSKYEVVFRFTQESGPFVGEATKIVKAKSHIAAIKEAKLRCVAPGMYYTLLSTEVIK